MNNITCTPAIRLSRVKKNGECTIFLRIIMNRKVIATININKSVNPIYWDEFKRCVKKSHPFSLIINTTITGAVHEFNTKLNELTVIKQSITEADVLSLLRNKKSVVEFAEFCMEFIPIRYCDLKQKETRRSYIAEVSKLSQFIPHATFYDINHALLEKYRAYMITELGNHKNTVWKSFKFIKCMFNHAIRNGAYNGKSPFDTFKIGKYEQGERQFLDLNQIDSITRICESESLHAVLKQVGYYYLFMCYTGLRFTDAINFNYNEHVRGDMISIITHKQGTKVDLYIHSRLSKVLEFIKSNPLKISNKQFNMYLKSLSTIACIDIPITAHVGRHTFGAMLAEMEVDKSIAQDLLGHKDSRSTSIYYHIKDKNKRNAMKRWDDL